MEKTQDFQKTLIWIK